MKPPLATLILALPLALLPFSAVLADSYKDCTSGDGADRRVSGCKAVLENGAQEGERRLRIARLRLGIAYMEQGRLEEAIAEFDTLIAAHPDYGWAYAGRGKAHFKQGDAESALRDFDLALRAGTNDLEIYELRAAFHLENGRFEEAIADYDALVARRAHLSDFHTRAMAYLRKGDPARAIDDFDMVIALSYYEPDRAVAGRRQAEEALRAAGKPVPPLAIEVERYNDHGAALYEKRFLPIADSAQLARTLAICTVEGLSSEDEREAKQVCEAVLRAEFATDDDRFAVYMSLGGTDYLAKAVALRPDSAEAHLRLGTRLGLNEDGLKEVDVAIALDPELAPAHYRRGQILHHHLRQHDQALKALDTAIELKPDFAYAYAARGDLFRTLEQYEQALADYDKAISAAPDSWLTSDVRDKRKEMLMARADQHIEARQFARAIEVYDALSAFEPDSSEPHALQGEAYAAMGQYRQAVKAYDAAIGISPVMQTAYVLRGEAYYAMGQYDLALADFDKVLALDEARRKEVEAELARESARDRARGAFLLDLSGNAERAAEGREKALCHLDQQRAQAGACDEPEASDEPAAQADLGGTEEQERNEPTEDEKQQQAALEQPAVDDNPPQPEPWPQAKVDEVLSDANTLLKEGKYEQVVAMLEPLVEQLPDNALARAIRGNAYMGLESYEPAASDLSRALDEAPDHVGLLSLRASAYQRSNRYQAAIQDLTRIIDTGTDDWSVWFRRGLAFKELKDHNNAIGDFHESFNIVMDGKVADEGAAREAEFKIRFERADSFLRLNMFNEAIEDFDITIEMQPGNSRLHYMRGNALAYAGRLDEAMEDAKEALRIEPDFEPAQQLRVGIESARNRNK